MKATVTRGSLALTLAMTAACTGTPKTPMPGHVTPKPGHVTVEGQDPRILIHDGTGSAMEALLSGQLVYNASTKCLTVKASGQSAPSVLVWPPATRPTIKDGKRGVRLKGFTLLEGAEVRITGGFVDWVKHPPPGLTLPDVCAPDSSTVAIFQMHPISPVG